MHSDSWTCRWVTTRPRIATLQPLVAKFDPASTPTELPYATFLADAIEALIQVGRGTEAEPLIGALERNGERRDRAWMLAAGARGRSMLLAARGDLDAARRVRHARDRRTRPAANAVRACSNAVATGPNTAPAAAEGIGVGEPAGSPRHLRAAACPAVGRPVPVPSSPAQNVGPRRSGQLTPSEQRVAELAASGMKNRDVATALFISPKTVEANLARIYRKLGIKSRAELGRHMSKA